MSLTSPVFVTHIINKLCCLMALFLVFGLAHAKEQNFLVLNYHDIVSADGPFNSTDVSIVHFEEHLSWLKKQGYHLVSVQNVLDAAAGKTDLPDKAVVLTFDDGYLSFYTKVFPLLRKHHYPATLALVGAWMDGDPSSYDAGKELLNWDQIRDMVKSGLVDIASHSYDLHKGVLANPQGNTQAAAVTRIYDDPMLVYETDEDYQNRLRKALLKSSDFILQHVGIRPKAMVWPYGEYNQIAVQAAREAGMPVTMGLVDGINTFADISALKRLIIAQDPDVNEFAVIVSKMRAQRPLRVAHLDMDFLYDKDAEQTERNLDLIIQRIKDMRINTVYLQAYSDPDGDGNADALYFPNRHLPVKQDLFNRVAWQLKNVARVKVYAWLPIMAYQGDIPKDWYVQEWRDGKAQASSHIYTRLSPFNSEARQFVADIYEDLAKHCNFDGILFHDDGILSDFEDVSPLALTYTKEVGGLPVDFNKLHATSAMRMAWAQQKTELINQFTDQLADRVRIYRPGIKTARNMYALPLLKPYSEEWYAQSFKSFLAHYDYVAIEAMPFMEEAKNPTQWLTQLVKTVAQQPDGLKKSVFELQAMNWKTQQKIPMPVFIAQLELLKKLNAQHIGYYPDNVFTDQPRLSDLQEHFALPFMP